MKTNILPGRFNEKKLAIACPVESSIRIIFQQLMKYILTIVALKRHNNLQHGQYTFVSEGQGCYITCNLDFLQTFTYIKHDHNIKTSFSCQTSILTLGKEVHEKYNFSYFAPKHRLRVL